MREIKFRGKSLESGEWVYGHYVFSNDTNFIVPKKPSSKEIDKYVEMGLLDSAIRENTKDSAGTYVLIWTQIEVDPKTVGQGIGQQDADKNDMYEGDFVSVEHRNVIESGPVIFCDTNASFAIDLGGGKLHSLFKEFKFLIIGNIYDKNDRIDSCKS